MPATIRPVEPRIRELAPDDPGQRRASRFRLGLASERQHHMDEVICATEAAARELGLEVRRVGTEADEASVDVLVAVGFPHYYPNLLRRPRRAHRILWYG